MSGCGSSSTLSERLSSSYVAAEVLHQSLATDARTLLLSAGSSKGVSPFDPVVSPEGLIGVVLSTADAYQHCHDVGSPGVPCECLYGHRQRCRRGRSVAVGCERGRGARVPWCALSRLGTARIAGALLGSRRGVPQGNPGRNGHGTGSRAGRLGAGVPPSSSRQSWVGRPCADPDRPAILRPRAAFPSDSQLQAQRLDSLLKARRADSLAQAAKEAAAARKDSLARIRKRTRPDSGAAPSAAPATPAPSRPPAQRAESARGDSAR